MKCIKCKTKMKEVDSMVTNNGKPGDDYREYKRKLYWCENDDIWIGVEVPQVPPLHIA